MPVATEKLPQRERVRGTIGADQHDVSVAGIPQGRSASQERAHENIAELGVTSNECPEVIGAELKQLASLVALATVDRPPARNHQQLAGELTGAIGCNQLAFASNHGDDLYSARDHDEDRRRFVVRLIEYLAGRDLPQTAKRPDPIDLCFSQYWRIRS